MGIFLVAIAVRVAMGIALGAFNVPPNGEMTAVAESIAATSVFGNPNRVPSGPTAHVAPVYPYLLAGLLKATGPVSFRPFVTTLNIVVASLLWAALPRVVVDLSLSRRSGLLAGIFGALNPINHWVELNGYWESTLSALCLLGLVGFTFRRRTTWTRPSHAAAIGAIWGLAVLLQPAVVTVFVVLLALVARTTWSRPATIRAATIAMMTLLLVVLPWTIRNYRTFGGFMFVRGNLGIELSVSNNDGALPTHENVLRNPQARHPHVSAVEFAKRNSIGELAYDRSRLKDAITWIRAHPARFASLTIQRVRLFWVRQRSWTVFSLLEWTTTALAWFGLGTLLWKRAEVGWWILGIWTVYPLMYYVVQVDERYRYPIEWTLVLSAAAGMCHITPVGSERLRYWKVTRAELAPKEPSAGTDSLDN